MTTFDTLVTGILVSTAWWGSARITERSGSCQRSIFRLFLLVNVQVDVLVDNQVNVQVDVLVDNQANVQVDVQLNVQVNVQVNV